MQSQTEIDRIARPIDHLLERLTVTNVFGAPVTIGAVTIIPVAQVSAGFGYGGGQGPAPVSGEDRPVEGPPDRDVASGGGGGGGGMAAPRGYIEITGTGARFLPIVDQTQIAVVSMVMAIALVALVSATVRAGIKARQKGAASIFKRA
jgi:uncharacterized spore protein YtfJ